MEEILTVQGAKAMKVSDLKAALQDRGLATDGLKSVLLARLIADIEKVPAEAQDSSGSCTCF